MAGAHRLHGTISGRILGADNIYDGNRFTGWALPGFLGSLAQDVEEATGVGKGLTKMYVTLDMDYATITRTRTVASPSAGNPRWNEQVRAHCSHTVADVAFTVVAEQFLNNPDTQIGRAFLPARELLAARSGETIERRLDIVDGARKKLPGGPKLSVQLSFREVESQGTFGAGVDVTGVPHTFFSQRQACRLTLYQDAHADDTFAPNILLASGGLYKPGKCWEDLFDAISKAKYLIYVSAWSVFTAITLVRDGRPGAAVTLGELLKRKADEGVRVLMLVWNDFSSLESLNALGIDYFSQMATSDEVTAAYFHGSRVQCVLCDRIINVISRPVGIFSSKPEDAPKIFFSHHQKAIVVDQELPTASSAAAGRRQIVAFLGGLDVCDGRYDTQSHSLFRTLGTGQAHSKDFHQASLKDAALGKGGPRQPWHDIHSKVEGPAAWDVLHNFEQRWRKQGTGKDLLVDLVALEKTVVPSSWPVVLPDDPEAWNVQVFRSIDDNSSLGFPVDKEAALEAGLVPGKRQLIERSIHDAYIHAIRAAKSFIYIENQYFIGSSFQWKADDGVNPLYVGSLNQIPRELSLKIVRKIEAGERFSVFVVVPMWPEGYPTSDTVQSTLDWQRRTMEMMYDDIATALQRMKMDVNPREYLSFFCLGNREVKKSGEYQAAGRPENGTHYAKAQMTRRFPIYIHSKLMIVDDEYIILGSANINQRSMEGSRDTEIAIGAYQPHRLNTKEDPTGARGQVHGFRMSLWYEHLGYTDKVFHQPGSLACLQMVNDTADKYWRLYTADKFNDDLPGHLLTYPMTVNKAGTLSPLKGFECFPDTQARVRGTSGSWKGQLTT